MQIQMNFSQMELHRIEHQFENIPHRHEGQFQVTVPFRGTCYLRQENSERILTAGSGLILHPNDRHSLHIEPGAGIVILKVDADSMYPPDWLERCEPPAWHRFNPGEIYDRFIAWTSGPSAAEQLEALAAEEIETQLLASLHKLLWGSGPAVYRKEACAQEHMSRVLEYMQAYYTEPLSIDMLSSIALQSRYHFMRSFKAAVGMTPYQYVLLLRVQKAKDCLLRTNETITDISYRLGFSSTSQFYRAFVKFVRATPEQFRLAGRC
ncbi:helix-turn-helix domain-containing protein [Paenibacillus sp. GCM10027626]|uniref:AraC family transcriptional regulator n=1 Tax=Paenibacillus sp. GCM10027626 TaxID=3273411 RepID=UPI00362BCA60